MNPLKTIHVHPPIPTRSHDWCAHRDGAEESGPFGWGKTEAEAVQDLLEQEADKPLPSPLECAVQKCAEALKPALSQAELAEKIQREGGEWEWLCTNGKWYSGNEVQSDHPHLTAAYRVRFGQTIRLADKPLPQPYEPDERISENSFHCAPDKPAEWKPITVEYHKSDTPERVCFYEQDFYMFSSFSCFEVVVWGLRFKAAEYAYHWRKFYDTSPKVAADIINARSAHDAFKIAQERKGERRKDWDEVKVDIMREILRAKVAQHEYVKRKLLATGNHELVEDSWRDDFWGWGPNKDGQNMLGKLWMEIREELRAPAPWSLPVLPAGLSELREKLGRRVREVWIEWAKRQPNPKPSWLVPYDELSEPDKEADRCIGTALWGDFVAEHSEAIANKIIGQ